ncbi:MAG: Maf family protein, partial [Gammaproteobacteria bacterium]|nr:Maf family protein [Gammaproteobacteria bacterium]
MGHGPRVLLASQSPYRRELLGRLLSAFECFTPDIDESPLPGEPPG